MSLMMYKPEVSSCDWTIVLYCKMGGDVCVCLLVRRDALLKITIKHMVRSAGSSQNLYLFACIAAAFWVLETAPIEISKLINFQNIKSIPIRS